MSPALTEIERRYRAVLRMFVEEDNLDEARRQANNLGRQAMVEGLGMGELINLHGKVITDLFTRPPVSKRSLRTIERSIACFNESLSPFETTLKDLRDDNEQLRKNVLQLNSSRQAVESERQRYLEQFDFAPDGYLVTDLNGTVEEANVAAAQMLHINQELLVGRSLSPFIKDEDSHKFENQLTQLKGGAIERVRNWQTTVKPRTGRSFSAALTVAVVRDKQAAPVGLRWLVRDISDLKSAEAERSEFLLREKIARVEAESARRVGFLAEASTLLAASLDSETTLRNVAQLSAPFLADWCFVYIMEDYGSFRRIAIAHGDPAKTDLARMFEGARPPNVPDWVQSALLSGRSEIVADLTGGMIESIATNEEHLEAIRSVDARSAMVVPLIARGRTLGFMLFLSAESGRIFKPADQVLVEDLARRCAFALDNSRLYSEVIIQRDKAEKANRSKDEFLAILSHELRNPLVPILGWVRILKNQATLMADDVLGEGIGSLERNAQNIQRLVDDCLDLVRTSRRSVRLSMESMDLNGIAVAAIEATAPLARDKGIKIEVQLTSEEVPVIGDRTRLEQVVTNLLANAVKFTRPGGSIQIRSDKDAGYARILVKDSGIGIARDFIEQIFEPFRKGSAAWLASDSGLGLGLSIAREITQLHSGRIWAESDGLGRGSTFVVALPLTWQAKGSSDGALAGGSQSTANPIQQKRLRILLVEDAADVLFLMKKEFDWNGFIVQTARDGESGLEIAKRDIPDLIVSDIKMPGMDGYQFMERLRAIPQLASIPAIALTGFGMERDADQARASGYTAHMVKPVDFQQLINLITQLTHERAA